MRRSTRLAQADEPEATTKGQRYGLRSQKKVAWIDRLPDEVLENIVWRTHAWADSSGNWSISSVARLVSRRWSSLADRQHWGAWMGTNDKIETQLGLLCDRPQHMQQVAMIIIELDDDGRWGVREAALRRMTSEIGRSGRWDALKHLDLTVTLKSSSGALQSFISELVVAITAQPAASLSYVSVTSQRHRYEPHLALVLSTAAVEGLFRAARTFGTLKLGGCQVAPGSLTLPLDCALSSSVTTRAISVTPELADRCASAFAMLIRDLEYCDIGVRAVSGDSVAFAASMSARLLSSALQSARLVELSLTWDCGAAIDLDALLHDRADLKWIASPDRRYWQHLRVHRSDVTTLALGYDFENAHGTVLQHLASGNAPSLRTLVLHDVRTLLPHRIVVEDEAVIEERKALIAYCAERGIAVRYGYA